MWLILLLAAALSFAVPAQAAWQTDYIDQAVANGSYGLGWQSSNITPGLTPVVMINDVFVDSDNNILSAGRIDTDGSSVDLYVARHDSNGTLLWEAVYDGGAYDEAVYIDQDSNGDVLVVGTRSNETDSEIDVVVLKYSIAGVLLWSRFDGVTGSLVGARAVVTGNGDIYVAATHEVGFFKKNIVLLQFDAANTATQLIGSYEASMTDGAAVVVDMTVAPNDGSIVIAGTSDESSKDVVLLKFNSDGTVPTGWQGGVLSSDLYKAGVYISAGSNDSASALHVDATGNLYVAGKTSGDCNGGFNAGKDNLIVLKIKADGTAPSAWQQPACYISNAGPVSPQDIAVDDDDNIFVVGQVGVGIDADALLVSFDSEGSKRWDRQLDYGSDDVLVELALTPSGAGGDLFAVGSGNNNTLLLHYGADGVQMVAFEEDLGGNDRAAALALGQDAYTNPAVYIGGASSDDGQNQGAHYLATYRQMRADLQAVAVDAPAVGAFGSQIDITSTISNVRDFTRQALGDAHGFDVSLYLWPAGLSVDPQTGAPFSADLIFLEKRNVSGLNSGQQDSVISRVAVPTITAADYHVVLIADGNDSVEEYDLASNVLVDVDIIKVFDPPDLEMTAVSGPATVSAAAPMSVNYTVLNSRLVAADPFEVGFFLSLDSIIGNGDDIMLQGEGIFANGLAGETEYPTQVDVTLPNDITPGDYYLIGWADINNDIVEADETNNTIITSAADIKVQPVPDLTVQSVNGPLGAILGDSFDVDTGVFNAVSVSDVTQDFTVSVYLSTDEIITASDYLLGSEAVLVDSGTGVSLATGELKAVAVTVFLDPDVLPVGSYFLGAIVDSQDVVIESNELNNGAAANERITIGDGTVPDLLVTGVSTEAKDIVRGSSFQVTASVANVLPKDVIASFQVGIYMSVDPDITSNDKRVGGYAINGLIGGVSVTSTFDVIIAVDSVEDVEWTNQINVDLTDKTLTGLVFNNAGASSVQSIIEDGAIEFILNENDKNHWMGFSVSDDSTSTSDFTHAFGANYQGRIKIIENGSGINFSDTIVNYKANKLFRIERNGGVVTFKYDGNVIYTSSLASTGPVLADAAFGHVGASISNAKIINVELPKGTYYLGAIVDDTSVIIEVDEDNNTQVQTDSDGVASSTVVSVQSAQGTPARGGGSLNLLGLIVLLMFVYGAWVGRRCNQVVTGVRS